MSQIQELIETEIENRVNERITRFADKVSKNYRIPLAILLRDFGALEPTSTPSTAQRNRSGDCLGVCANGNRCAFRAVNDGYCKKHQGQKKAAEPTKVDKPIHNHTIPPLFCADCPACKRNRPADVKPVIELGALIFK